MARKSFVLLLVGAIIFFLCSVSSADVPHMISYSGKVTKVHGGPLNGTFQVTFSIYPDTSGSVADWTEAHPEVVVKHGLFSVLLGSVNPLPSSVFDGNIKYLGVRVESDPEMRPLTPIVSVAYAYRAGKADIDCEDCYHRFVNVEGPDSVVAASDMAFQGKVSGGSASYLSGIGGYGENTSTGDVYGGYFETSTSGTGTHYGILAEGQGASSAWTYGSYGFSRNYSAGPAWGGFFVTSTAGTGNHYGLGAYGYGSSSAPTYGSYSSAENTSTGPVYGGVFKTSPSGTGDHYAVMAQAYGSSSAWTQGVVGFADNPSSGYAYGGNFYTSSSGTGYHFGVNGTSYGSSSAYAYGCRGSATSTSTGRAYGVSGTAENTSTGNAYGGSFFTSDSGSGEHYGITASGYANSSAKTYGCWGSARNDGSGDVYGGYFHTYDFGTGTKYGVYATAPVEQGYAGYFQGDVRITDSLVVLGGKSVAVRVNNGEYRLLYCQESPENWFEDFGEDRLTNGKTIVNLDPLFCQTVNTNITYHVFLTPGGDCNGLYVINKTPASFEVRELQGGDSNMPFSYRIVAKRKGYENIRLAKMGEPTPQEMAAKQAKHKAEFEQEMVKMRQEKLGMEEERARMEQEREEMEEERARMEQQRLEMERERKLR
ncbi:MAG: hypothetical protein AMJ73_01270 [candidate division Zixibacteria bacterium SM1_73]|nr:MAG: hypothetical protein AMJ73_01270 [candidate division Zixibacteria bacterium SM1_73]